MKYSLELSDKHFCC